VKDQKLVLSFGAAAILVPLGMLVGVVPASPWEMPPPALGGVGLFCVLIAIAAAVAIAQNRRSPAGS
jgi:hypothetical protein